MLSIKHWIMNTRYQPIDASFSFQNRKRFTRDISPQAMAVFLANDPMPRSGDQTFPVSPKCPFLLFNGHRSGRIRFDPLSGLPQAEYKEILFIRRTNEHLITWKAPNSPRKKPKHWVAFRRFCGWIRWKEFFMPWWCNPRYCIWMEMNRERFQNPVPSRITGLPKKYGKNSPACVGEAQPILRNLVMIKAPQEVETMRTAIRITGDAFQRVCTSPATGYHGIRAGSRNDLRVHSTGEPADMPMNPSLPVVPTHVSCITFKTMHACGMVMWCYWIFGAEYGNYAADLSRSIPVSGRFSSKAGTSLRCRPAYVAHGQTNDGSRTDTGWDTKESESYLGYELHALGLVNAKSPDKKDIQRYFMHGIGHHLRLDVHDLADRNLPLQAGMVITACEPAFTSGKKVLASVGK